MSTDNREGKNNLTGCLVWGCVGSIVIVLGAYIAFAVWVNRTIATLMSSPSTPPVRTKPYAFGYGSECAHVEIQLPDGYGTITYMHGLFEKGPEYPHFGARALHLAMKEGKTQKWPLLYSPLDDVRVGFYWYPEKTGLGPFLRLYDATGEALLDLKRKEIGEMSRTGASIQMYDYAYDDYSFMKGAIPPVDVTSAVCPGNCKYLGSVIRHEDKLVFMPAPTAE